MLHNVTIKIAKYIMRYQVFNNLPLCIILCIGSSFQPGQPATRNGNGSGDGEDPPDGRPVDLKKG